MSFFVLKIFLTPLLILGATLAARRWGPIIGGVIVGLPLTSGPTSVFLALERGNDFASLAAHSSLFGSTAGLFFCIAYALLAPRYRWPVTVAIALGVYFAGVTFFSLTPLPPLAVSVVSVTGVVVIGLLLIKPARGERAHHAPPPWDLPFRVIISTLIVVVITAVSRLLGPQLSGIFSAMPAIVCVMSIFTHEIYGPNAVKQFERGVIVGTFGYIAFFLIVTLGVTRFNLFTAYALAALVSSAINLGICTLSMPRRKKKQPA
ncbi:hypothetical protein LJC23_05095 [Desulfovibrio sp. OttesenSCG-928-I05]|nr:hypothetical protein [Desulfovibrio sp. OttesenSCG-928-I05]